MEDDLDDLESEDEEDEDEDEDKVTYSIVLNLFSQSAGLNLFGLVHNK